MTKKRIRKFDPMDQLKPIVRNIGKVRHFKDGSIQYIINTATRNDPAEVVQSITVMPMPWTTSIKNFKCAKVCTYESKKQFV